MKLQQLVSNQGVLEGDLSAFILAVDEEPELVPEMPDEEPLTTSKARKTGEEM